MPDKFFISYSRVDTTFVLKLANDLKNAGVNIWLDQLNIPPGAHWDNEIEAALHSATCVLAIISPQSMESKNAMDEISFALEQDKKVIPVLLTNTETPFRLRRLQRIDFTGEYEKGVNQLLKAIQIADANIYSTRPPSYTKRSDQADEIVAPQRLTKEDLKNIIQDHLSDTKQTLSLPKKENKSKSLFYGIVIFVTIAATAGITWRVMKLTNNRNDSIAEGNQPTVLSNRVIISDSLKKEQEPATTISKGKTTVEIVPDRKIELREGNPKYSKPAEENRTDAKVVKPDSVVTVKPVDNNKISVTSVAGENQEHTNTPEANRATKPVSETPVIVNETKSAVTEPPVVTQSPKSSLGSGPGKITIRRDIKLFVAFTSMPDINKKREMQPVTLIVTEPLEYEGKVIIEKGATAEGEISIGSITSSLIIKKIKSAGREIIPSPRLEDGVSIKHINLTRVNPIVIEKRTKFSY